MASFAVATTYQPVMSIDSGRQQMSSAQVVDVVVVVVVVVAAAAAATTVKVHCVYCITVR